MVHQLLMFSLLLLVFPLNIPPKGLPIPTLLLRWWNQRILLCLCMILKIYALGIWVVLRERERQTERDFLLWRFFSSLEFDFFFFLACTFSSDSCQLSLPSFSTLDCDTIQNCHHSKLRGSHSKCIVVILF